MCCSTARANLLRCARSPNQPVRLAAWRSLQKTLEGVCVRVIPSCAVCQRRWMDGQVCNQSIVLPHADPARPRRQLVLGLRLAVLQQKVSKCERANGRATCSLTDRFAARIMSQAARRIRSPPNSCAAGRRPQPIVPATSRSLLDRQSAGRGGGWMRVDRRGEAARRGKTTLRGTTDTTVVIYWIASSAGNYALQPVTGRGRGLGLFMPRQSLKACGAMLEIEASRWREGEKGSPTMPIWDKEKWSCKKPPLLLLHVVGEILKQGGERLQNLSTPRPWTTTTIFLKTIKECRLIL